MRIVVCIKSITQNLSGSRDALPRLPVDLVARVNPQDLIALAEALALREEHGGEVVVLSLDHEEGALKRGLTVGADRAILVEDSIDGQADWYLTSLILARAISSSIKCDLILCGTSRNDVMDEAVGPAIAEQLGIPVIVQAIKMAILKEKPGTVQVHKKLPKGMREIYEISFPFLATIVEGLTQPEYVPLFSRRYRQALTKSVEHITLEQLCFSPPSLLPRTTALDVGPPRIRTKLGVKVTGLSLAEKLRLLSGDTLSCTNKNELIVHDPKRATSRFLTKMSEWRSEHKS